MKRIGVFIDTFNIGGAETVAINLCRELLKEPDYQPICIHFDADAIAERCNQYGIPQLSAPARQYYKKTTTLPLFAWQFHRFLRWHQIDVLHSHLFGPIVAAALATWMSRIPHIGTLHDTYTIEERPARVHLLRLAALLKTKLIAVSRQMEDYYRSRGGFSQSAFVTIYNGVSINMPFGERRDSIRKTLGIEDKEVVIVCVARLVKLKRHDLLIQAVRQIASTLNIHLVIVGDGPEREELDQLVRQQTSAHKITFLGERDDVADILTAADIFTLTSDTEGLSCSILEAMAAGLPVVATNVGGNFELVTEGQNGFLVNKRSTEQITKKLQQLSESPILRKELGRESLGIARSRFDWSTTFSLYKQLYDV